jgi:hypothetical protein
MAMVWPASMPEVRRRRSVEATSVSTTTRLTHTRPACPGGVEVDEERLVLLVGLERVDGRSQIVNRIDRADSLPAEPRHPVRATRVAPEVQPVRR